MTTTEQVHRRRRINQLASEGWLLEDVNAVLPHHSSETPEHWFAKTALCWLIRQNGGTFFTEVEYQPTGRIADVLYVNESEPISYVIEVESSYSKADVEKKLAHFHVKRNDRVVGDILFCDPSDLDASAIDTLQHSVSDCVPG